MVRALALVALIVALGVLWWVVDVPEVGDLRDRIAWHGAWSWLVFAGLYTLVALTPFPVTVMALAGGLLFGVAAGSLLSVLGSSLGAIGAYGIARAVGRSTVLRLIGKHRRTVEERLEDAGFTAVFTLRVVPGLPYWPVNYGAGALGVDFREFVGACFLAAIPAQTALVSIGAFLEEPSLALGLVFAGAALGQVVLTVLGWRAWRDSGDAAGSEDFDQTAGDRGQE